MKATYISDLRSITPTKEDINWLSRMLWGEGGPRPGDVVAGYYLGAIVRRCLWWRTKRSLASMARAFSQPINQKWQADGAFCAIGGKYHGRDECSPARLKRRAEICTGKVPARCSELAEMFAEGCLRLGSYRGVLGDEYYPTNWASYPGVDKKFPGGACIDGEYFFMDKLVRHHKSDIRIEVSP